MRSSSLKIKAWCLAFDRRLLGFLDLPPTIPLPGKGLRGLVEKELKCGTTNGSLTITGAAPSRRALFHHAVSYRESQRPCVHAPKTEINRHGQSEAGSVQLAMHSPRSRSTTQSYPEKRVLQHALFNSSIPGRHCCSFLSTCPPSSFHL